MTSYPDLIQELAQEEIRKWKEFLRSAEDAGVEIPADDFEPNARRAFLVSDFITRSCTRRPELLVDLFQRGELNRPCSADQLRTRLNSALVGVEDEASLMEGLRRFRTREMVRIAWRDVCGWATPVEIMANLSMLADIILDRSLTILSKWQVNRYGQPLSPGGLEQHLVILGMGKLGAEELNFSSDVDLVFAYPLAGTAGTDQPNDEFFIRLGRQLIRVIHTPTADGYVFRVDMDLRPYGKNGPLVMHFDAMEDYFVSQGREWERYAWIKARPVAGDIKAGDDWINRLNPFVYRRYLDYGVIESLREMKAGIAADVKRKGVQDNIKLGPGGIREIEFFGQVFQLLRGGVIPSLQQRPILSVLNGLVEEKIVSASVADELSKAYLFLRRVENHLQIRNDQQTHQLPVDDPEWQRLSLSLGTDDVTHFRQILEQHRRSVQTHFEALLEPDRKRVSNEKDETANIKILHQFWRRLSAHTHTDDNSADANAFTSDNRGQDLPKFGFENPENAIGLLTHFLALPPTQALSREGRKRLDRLMPTVLAAIGKAGQPEKVLNRILDLIAAIETRSVYLAMLIENPSGIDLLVRLAEASPMIVTLLAKHPVLLDELLDPRLLYQPPLRSEMQHEIDHRLASIPVEDLEFQMETLCVFKQVNILRVAAADVTGNLPLMNVSDRLTDIAEIILKKVVALAWNHLVERHGPPACTLENDSLEHGFAVIAYGKLGGFELGYASDLDLVFLHAGCSGQTTNGDRPIDSPQFFNRLGQRVIHLLSTRTSAGMLYEIDMRLRPDGGGGILVTHIDSFEDYQQNTARIWEHQALIKARPIIGDPLLVHRFNTIRQQVLQAPRDPVDLQNKVNAMAEKLRAEHGSHSADTFNLKFDPGGIVDIEFLVQYLVLRLSQRYSDLTDWTDNVRLIQTLIETGIIAGRQAYLLKQAYLSYRMVVHRLALQEKPANIDMARFQKRRRFVIQLWHRFLTPPTSEPPK